MTRRRWIADEVSDDRAAVTGEHAEHLSRVLRAQVGQEFEIATGGVVRCGRILSVSDARVEFELGDVVPAVVLPEITLLLAIFKFDRMEWAIEKCTELGVARILPVIARRTDPHLAAASAKRIERWQRLAHQASEQSRRSSAPAIALPAKVCDAVRFAAPTRILLAETEEHTTLADRLNPAPPTPLALAIGPEGGWAVEEVAAFTGAGWLAASLGPTILRVETAAIAALAIAVSQLS